MLTAAAAISVTGRYAPQGLESAQGLQIWADLDEVNLEIVDDEGSTAAAVMAYRRWIAQDIDLLLGPYGSGQTRRVLGEVAQAGRLLWNHGGAADDLARPGVVSVVAPASTYFHDIVKVASDRGLARVMVAGGRGRFAATVVQGAVVKARRLGVPTEVVSLQGAPSAARADVAVLAAGQFDDDVAVVRQIREAGLEQPALLGCVAAGIPEFERRLARSADSVVGPVQWVPRAEIPLVGPSGTEFSELYLKRFGAVPSYVAAQAAAAGFLAADAHRRYLSPAEIRQWQISTLLGNFVLDNQWQQTGHNVATIQWRHGAQHLITPDH